MTSSGPVLACTFCGKSEDEVTKLIAGPAAAICGECVAVSFSILAQDEEWLHMALRQVEVVKAAAEEQGDADSRPEE
jgi:ATP-dependent protease Clp ATPase subunit